MQEQGEEQIISRLFSLENEGAAQRRAELTDQRFLSLIQDPQTGGAYIFRHGADPTEGAEVPEGTEFWEYPTPAQAEVAFAQLLAESRQQGELVEEDSEEGLGDSDAGGAEMRDLYSASEEDPLIWEGETKEPGPRDGIEGTVDPLRDRPAREI